MPSTNGHGPKRAILYARVSTDEQVKEGYSLAGQLQELRRYATVESYEVLAEVVDPGEKRWTLDRPGIHELREMVSAGGVDVVLAHQWDRFGESPWPEVLALELEEYGTALRSLDDSGEGEDAELFCCGFSKASSPNGSAARQSDARVGKIEKVRGGKS
jgi:DNA invertase Pin-like site-specific DNA recombinase